jgi:hypothetical protein
MIQRGHKDVPTLPVRNTGASSFAIKLAAIKSSIFSGSIVGLLDDQ